MYKKFHGMEGENWDAILISDNLAACVHTFHRLWKGGFT